MSDQQTDDVDPILIEPDASAEWEHGLCDCFERPDWCVIGCVMPAVLFMRIGDHLKNISEVKFIILLLVMASIFFTVSSSFENTAARQPNDIAKIIFGGVGAILAIIGMALAIVYCVQLAKLRGYIRSRYGIEGSEVKDCCVVCWCTTCCCGLQNCQMFQEVASHETMIME